MVRLQKRFAYKYKDKDHFKYVVTIPAEAVEKLGLKPDTELNVSVSSKSIVLKPVGVNEALPSETRERARRNQE